MNQIIPKAFALYRLCSSLPNQITNSFKEDEDEDEEEKEKEKEQEKEEEEEDEEDDEKEKEEDIFIKNFIEYMIKEKHDITEILGENSLYLTFFIIFKKFPTNFFDYLRKEYPPCNCERTCYCDRKENLIKNILKNIIISIAQSGKENYTYFNYIIHYFYSENHTFYRPGFDHIRGKFVKREGINDRSAREVLFDIFKEIIRKHNYLQDKEDYAFYPGDPALFYPEQPYDECREMHKEKETLYRKIFFDIIIPGYVSCFLSYETGVDPVIFCLLDKYGVNLDLDVVRDIVQYNGLNYEELRDDIERSNKRVEKYF